MRLVILLSLAAFAAANSAFTAENYYGYDFHPEPQTYHAPEPFTRGLTAKLKSWAERFPMIKSLIASKTTTLPVELQKVTNNGYTHYSQSAAMQAVEGVDAANFDPFASYLLDSLEIIGKDKRDGFLASMELIKFADNSDWTLVDIIFNQKDGANCKYVCVLGHRDIENNRYDFMVADFKSSFQLAPDIVIIEERKSYLWGLVQRANIRVERIPAGLKVQDVELLKTFFCQAALSRFAKMLDINVPTFEEPFVDPLTVISVISAGLDIFQKVINIFKTTSTSTIIKEIAGEGFSHYEQSAKTQVVQGITDDNVRSKLIPVLPRLLGLNKDVFAGVSDAIEIGLFAESNTWNDFKVAFSQDNSAANTVQFVDVVCANRGDDKFNIILVNVAQAFKLAPDVKYIENSKSYVGGIYSETKIERKEYPRSLTEKDLEVLMAFFHITVYKRLGAQYNLKVPQLPERPPLKP